MLCCFSTWWYVVPLDIHIHISQAIVSVLSKLPSKLTLECKHKKRSEQNWQAACVISFLLACCSMYVQGIRWYQNESKYSYF